MRSAWRFALAVFVALVLADVAHWSVFFAMGSRGTNTLAVLRDGLCAVVAFFLAGPIPERRRIAIALLGTLAAWEVYLAVYGRLDAGLLARSDLILYALAQGFGLLLGSRGEPRWIDGLLCAVPVVVTDFLLSAVSSLRALGDNFSVGVVTPHLVAMLVWGGVFSIVLPILAGRKTS